MLTGEVEILTPGGNSRVTCVAMGRGQGARGAQRRLLIQHGAGRGVRKDGLEQVASKLKLKDEENLASENEGKDMASRMNRMCQASESKRTRTAL